MPKHLSGLQEYKQNQIKAFKESFIVSDGQINYKHGNESFSFNSSKGLKSAITKCFNLALKNKKPTFNKQVIYEIITNKID